MTAQAQPTGATTLETGILVCGAGAAGLLTGLALAQAGVDVIVAGPAPVAANGRTVALFDGSIRFLESLGVWERASADAASLSVMRLIDDTGSLFRIPPVEFRASEIGLDRFGANIETHVLVRYLLEAAQRQPNLRLLPELLDDFRFEGEGASARAASGATVSARLIVAADGRASPARRAAGIPASSSPYGQTALTAVFAHDAPHRDASTEFHTRGGPFTLVPMTDAADGLYRSGLVWLMRDREVGPLFDVDDAALARIVERQAHSVLGKMRLEGKRGRFPMATMTVERLTGPRIALVSEAAHVFPPIGAQGLNLGMRDAAHLVEAILAAREAGEDIGGSAALARYEALRKGDVASRTTSVDILNRSLLADFLPVDFLRGAGLATLASVGPLRRAVMRRGVLPQSGAPLVMRRPEPPRALAG